MIRFKNFLYTDISRMKKSFTLLETSICMGVVAVLMSVSVVGALKISNNITYNNNKTKIENIKKALKNHFKIYRHLPKPAKYTLAKNDNNYGKEKTLKDNSDIAFNSDFYSQRETYNTTQNATQTTSIKINVNYVIYRGILPFKDLGLLEEDVIDAYGNFFEYYVPEVMTIKDYSSFETYDKTYSFQKIGFDIKNKITGSYYKYSCPAVASSTPNLLCNENSNLFYGANFERKISNSQTDYYVQAPYGLRVRDVELQISNLKRDSEKGVQNDPTQSYIDNNGEIAYVILSHGENGAQTCSLLKPSSNLSTPQQVVALENCAKMTEEDENDYTRILTNDEKMSNCTKSNTSIYEAQNCLTIKENSYFSLIGREKFASAKNHEITFYRGNKSEYFDDIVEFDTLANLIQQ